MSKYLIIESCDPYESTHVREHLELSVRLKREGHEVVLFLVQNGVLPTRAGASHEELRETIEAGVEVLVDEFSMCERGIATQDLMRGVAPSALDCVVNRMSEAWKVLFV